MKSYGSIHFSILKPNLNGSDGWLTWRLSFQWQIACIKLLPLCGQSKWFIMLYRMCFAMFGWVTRKMNDATTILRCWKPLRNLIYQIKCIIIKASEVYKAIDLIDILSNCYAKFYVCLKSTFSFTKAFIVRQLREQKYKCVRLSIHNNKKKSLSLWANRCFVYSEL